MKYGLVLDPAKNGPDGVLNYAVGGTQEWGILTEPGQIPVPLLFRTFDEAGDAARDITLLRLDEVIGIAGVQEFAATFPKGWGEIYCVEASVFSTITYIACGLPAVSFVFHRRDNRAYAMCEACACHNRDNRRGEVISQKEGTGL